MGEQKPEKTKKHICAGLLAHVSAYNIWNEIVTMNEKLNQGFSEVEIVL